MQRLFSTFGGGWPGGGLLLQRLFAGSALVYCGYACVNTTPMCAGVLTQAIAGFGGLMLMAGLWTPVAGVVVAVLEARVAMLSHEQPAIPIVLAILALTLAMIGPGTWSVDAWMFGRKHIVPPDL